MANYLSLNIIILVILIGNCSNHQLEGTWYLEGENIVFNFKEKHLTLQENGNTILIANETPLDKNNLTYKIIRLDPTIKSKYSINSLILFSKIIDKDDMIISNIKLPDSNYRYTLNKYNKKEMLTSFSLLYNNEVKEFLKDEDFEPANKRYLLRGFSSNNNNKANYLIDKQYTSYWHEKINYAFNDFFEFFFYNKNGMKLNQKLKVKGIGFISKYTQNYGSVKEKDKFHRTRKIAIQFTNHYNGGIGKTKALYNNQVYNVELNDKSGLQIIYFYKSVFCKGVKLTPKDIYIGLKNELRLYEIIFYIE
jgi:hypothetical protein